jgi:hypothetical protein
MLYICPISLSVKLSISLSAYHLILPFNGSLLSASNLDRHFLVLNKPILSLLLCYFLTSILPAFLLYPYFHPFLCSLLSFMLCYFLTQKQYCAPLPLNPAFSTATILFHLTLHSVLSQYCVPLPPNPAFSTVPILCPSSTKP